jgi:hypothetical protein
MHLFFDCVVATELWETLSPLNGISEQVSKLSVSSWCVSDKNCKNKATLWPLWKLINDICFHRSGWCGLQVLYLKIAYILVQRRILFPKDARGWLKKLCGQLEWLMWLNPGGEVRKFDASKQVIPSAELKQLITDPTLHNLSLHNLNGQFSLDNST